MNSGEIVKLIKNHKNDIRLQWINRMKGFDELDNIQSISDRMIDLTNERLLELIFDYVNGEPESNKIKELSERVTALGWPLSYLMYGMQTFRIVLSGFIVESAEDKAAILHLVENMSDLLDHLFVHIIINATEAWQNTVSIQKKALIELSAPLIPVIDKIAVMPLIGSIDTERARYIMENVLNGVIAHRAEVVLIDITGVPIVDTVVAHHIIQVQEAVRLLGAECILVGIRPEIAQTIVQLGIGLGQFPTRSTLQKGMEYALQITKRKIVSTERQD
ncbi:MAG: STAS domain-containing protein [Tuberibacillus sp.]